MSCFLWGGSLYLLWLCFNSSCSNSCLSCSLPCVASNLFMCFLFSLLAVDACYLFMSLFVFFLLFLTLCLLFVFVGEGHVFFLEYVLITLLSFLFYVFEFVSVLFVFVFGFKRVYFLGGGRLQGRHARKTRRQTDRQPRTQTRRQTCIETRTRTQDDPRAIIPNSGSRKT